MTYTVVTLEITDQAYDEIAGKLKAAGYKHPFTEDGASIYMHGLALTRESGPGPDQECETEQCRYCKGWFPKPVSLHHDEAECEALAKIGATCQDEGCPHYGTPHAHPTDACPDCGSEGACKPGCPSRLPDSPPPAGKAPWWLI